MVSHSIMVSRIEVSHWNLAQFIYLLIVGLAKYVWKMCSEHQRSCVIFVGVKRGQTGSKFLVAKHKDSLLRGVQRSGGQIVQWRWPYINEDIYMNYTKISYYNLSLSWGKPGPNLPQPKFSGAQSAEAQFAYNPLWSPILPLLFAVGHRNSAIVILPIGKFWEQCVVRILAWTLSVISEGKNSNRMFR